MPQTGPKPRPAGRMLAESGRQETISTSALRRPRAKGYRKSRIMPFQGRLVPRGQLLARPASQPAGTTQSVAYELGNLLQLDRDHCLLVASLDEQGGGDKCVGNDGFVIRSLADVRAERAIPLNRPDPSFTLVDGKKAWLSKGPATGGFVPLGAVRDDGSPHPAAGSGFLGASCINFNEAGTSMESGCEALIEFLELRWDGRRLTVKAELIRSLMGLPVVGQAMCGFLPDGDGFLAPFLTERGNVMFRFELQGNKWTAVAQGEPFMAKPVTGPIGHFNSATDAETAETECCVRKANGAYWASTRGNDAMGRLYRSTDGLNYHLFLEHPTHTVPQPLNQGLDGNLYLATNPFPGPDGAWLRNPLVIRPFEGDRFGDPIIAHDVDGIRTQTGDQIPFVDHAMGSNVHLEGRWRHFLCFRVSDLKERTVYTFQKDLKSMLGEPRARSSKSGLYAVEIEYDRVTHTPFRFGR